MIHVGLVIEPVNVCGLKCPSCPTGRREIKPNKDVLTAERLQRYLEAISKEVAIDYVNLFNWSDPLLHPDIPSLIKAAREFAPTSISTTGNAPEIDVDALVEAKPDRIIVAVSATTQELYKIAHTGGRLERAIKLLDALKGKPLKNVTVTFHRYRHNIEEEPKVRELARSRGFNFFATWACQQPVESYIDNEDLGLLVVPVPEQRLLLADKKEATGCCFIDYEIALTTNGDVRGCCVSKDLTTTFGNVLEKSFLQILEDKKRYSLCGRCFKTRANFLACGLSVEIDKEAAKRIGRHRVKYFVERSRKRLWKLKLHKN